jgi:hypothetical protein
MNQNKEKQENAYQQLVKIATEAGIDFVAVLDDDVYSFLANVEGAESIAANLTPEKCEAIRQEVIERISEQYSEIIEESVNSVLADEIEAWDAEQKSKSKEDNANG